MWGKIYNETLTLNDDGTVSPPDVPGIGIEPRYETLSEWRVEEGGSGRGESGERASGRGNVLTTSRWDWSPIRNAPMGGGANGGSPVLMPTSLQNRAIWQNTTKSESLARTVRSGAC